MKPRQSLFLLTGLALAACSTISIESKKIDYKSAGKLPPLEVPPDLTAPGRDERYVVPDLTPRGSATYSAYTAERAGTREAAAQEILPAVEKMRIERAGSQRWLVVPGTPEKLWPTIKEFWQELGFIINVERPDAGIMETDWAENRAKLPQDVIRATLGRFLDQIYSTPERDKFRTRLERGAEEGTTEIYISHRGMYEAYADEGKGRTVWQPRPADPELEAEMLRRLMVRLGTQETRAKALMAETRSEERARLVRAQSGPGTLQLFEAFDRSWRRVGLALDRVGFTVEDRDRSKGLYYVRYVDPEIDTAKKSEGGFLSRLRFWDSGKPAANQQFRIFVKGEGDGSTVQVLSREGGVDNSDTAKKILGLLYEQLK